MPKSGAVWAVDIGGAKIAAARVTRKGEVSGNAAIPIPSAAGYAVAEAIVRLLEQIPAKGIGEIGVDVLGLACPDGHVWALNIHSWERISLGSTLKKRFRLPTLVESDRNAFVVGETWQGLAQNRWDVVFLTIGTGIGGGILAGRRLLRSNGELAGSVGWMALSDRFQPIYQKIGCFEAHGSGTGIGLAASREFGRKLSTRELTAMARNGDRTARSLLEKAGRDLGLALANLVDVLKPEVIVVGGGIAAGGNLLLETAPKAMKQWGRPLAVRQVRVVRSLLGTWAGLLGAARLAFDYCDRLQA